MFLTQQVPWAVQRALWEYGWMSVLGLVSNCKHLEAGSLCPTCTWGVRLHGEHPGGSRLLLLWEIKMQDLIISLATTWTHGHTRTHSAHNMWRLSTSLHPIQPHFQYTHTNIHTAEHSPLWLAHNGRLMSPRPSGPPQGALQLWPLSPPCTPAS